MEKVKLSKSQEKYQKIYPDICYEDVQPNDDPDIIAPPRVIRPHVRKYQIYCELREKCLQQNILFEDPEFVPNDSALGYTQIIEGTRWHRPTELCKHPVFWGGEGPSRFSVKQGAAGNCWLIATIATLAMYPELLYKVVPKYQSFHKNYAGIFIFHFWKYGKWIDVVVDDRLPCIKKEPIYMRSSLYYNEFWCSLLEKAYAKIHGSYEALDGGEMGEAMVDLTGGIAENHNVQREAGLFDILLRSNDRQSLIGCSINAPSPELMEAHTPEGLIKGHAYSITKVTEVILQVKNRCVLIPLVRLRNPWGHTEWNGPYRDGGSEWDYISKDQKEEIGLQFQQDGEFWMSYRDFKANFDVVEICYLTPNSLLDSTKIPWDCHMFEGEWVKGNTAGGCSSKNRRTFWKNPQYRICLQFSDPEGDGKCTVCISLMQKYRRSMKRFGTEMQRIGFEIYHLTEKDLEEKPIPKRFFSRHTFVTRSLYVTSRETYRRLRLPLGNYLIVPATVDPNMEAEFLLRVFATGETKMREHDKELTMTEPCEKIQKLMVDSDREIDRYLSVFYELKQLEIGWKQIKIIMNHIACRMPFFVGFNKEIVRSAIAMVDDNRNGKIDPHEFVELVRRLLLWKAAFDMVDRRHIGILAPFHMGSFMRNIGFDLNHEVLNMLVHRYGRDDGSVYFDDCIMCAIKVTALFSAFKRQLEAKRKIVDFRLVDWLEATLFS